MHPIQSEQQAQAWREDRERSARSARRSPRRRGARRARARVGHAFVAVGVRLAGDEPGLPHLRPHGVM